MVIARRMQTQSSLSRTPNGKLVQLSVALAFFMTWAGTSAAQESPKSQHPIVVDFEYQAETECPGEEQAFSLVHRRSRRVVRARGQDAGQRLSMTVIRGGTGYRGVLSVIRAGGVEERRSMTGESCDEVVEALALTAALSIDPNATLTLGPAQVPDAPDVDSSNARRESSEAVTDDRSPGQPIRTRIVVGASLYISRLVGGATHLGGGASIGLSRLDGRVLLPVETRLSVFGLGDVSGVVEPKIVTSFVLARLSYCVARLGGDAALLLCPSGELGAVFARGQGFEQDSRTTRLMAGLGAEVWLRARLGEAAAIWLSPSLMVPVTDRAYAVAPGPQVLTSTVDVSWGVSLGFGWAF